MTATIRPTSLLVIPGYLRLWFAGGVGNAMRWLELLAAGVYVWDQTGSALLVALVTTARSLPMLLLGGVAGVISEAVNRKTLLVGGLVLMTVSTAGLCLLAGSGLLQVWHLAVGGVIAGTVWAGEMSVRRRMLGELMPAPHVGQAVAFDSMTASVARIAGPLAGGALYQLVGIAGAYLVAALAYLAIVLVVSGLRFEQVTRPLRLARIPSELAEGLAAIRQEPLLQAVMLITVIMNMFAFSYSALVAPLGLGRFAVSPTLVGALAAAEPLGALATGLALANGWLGTDRPRILIRGSFLFLLGLLATALSPAYWLAFGLLLAGGLGTAAFGIMQTSLTLTHAPAAVRSRVMGIVTMCIGTGPLGQLLTGALAEQAGPSGAILIMASIGFGLLGLVWLRLPEIRA